MLNNFQREIVKLLATTRSHDSYFAGGSVLNFSLPRCSEDCDIFHDKQSVCIKSFITDIAVIRQGDYEVNILRHPEQDGIGEVNVSKNRESTIIQWATDSAFRFFPIEKDDNFGFKLNYIDLATNKILAMAGRGLIRDYHDICEMLLQDKPLDAYIWAACAKDPGYSPLSLLEHMSRHSKFQNIDLDKIASENKLSLIEYKEIFMQMIFKCNENFAYAPCAEYGTLFLRKEDQSVFWPAQHDFKTENYIRHYARPFGSMPEIIKICGE